MRTQTQNLIGKQSLWLLCLCLVLWSCEGEDIQGNDTPQEVPSGLVPKTFRLYQPNESRTYRENGIIGWSDGDVIYYYGDHSLQLRTATVSVDGSGNASVQLLFAPEDVEFVVSYGAPIKVSDYFNKEDIWLDTSGKMLKDGQFSTSQILVAIGNVNSEKLMFYNANGMIKFKIERSDIKYINIFDNRGQPMDGRMLSVYGIGTQYNYRNYYDYNEPDGGNTSVIQMFIDGPGEYYFPIPEVSAYNYDESKVNDCFDGLVIDCYGENNTYLGTVWIDKKFVVKQNQIYDLGVIDSRLQSLEEIYVIPDEQSTNPVTTFIDRKGNTVRVEKQGNESYGETITYKSTFAVLPENIDDIKNHPENIHCANFYSDVNGRPQKIETDKEIVEISYSEDGKRMTVSTIYRDTETAEVKQMTYPEMQNPNYGKNIGYPINFDKVKAYYPSEVLGPWKIIEPVLNILSFMTSQGIMRSINAILLGSGFGASAFGNPQACLVVSFISLAVAVGVAVVAGLSSLGITTVAGVCIGLPLVVMGLIQNAVSLMQDNIVAATMGNVIPVTLGAEIINESKVRLHCAVNQSIIGIQVGIMIAYDDGISFITHAHNIDHKCCNIEPDQQEYSFDFSVQPNKKYKYRAYTTIDDNRKADLCKYGEVKTFYTYSTEDEGGKAVDLGLPSGTKWASCNVGASSPEESGGYFAWGETFEKERYEWEIYLYYQNEKFMDIGSDIAGTQYDVAHVRMGGSWQMPTQTQIQELKSNCTRKWINFNGVNGYLVTGKNGNSIFLPAAGDRWYDNEFYFDGSWGHYWSSTLYPGGYGAYGLYIDCDYWNSYDGYRSIGQCVRAVCL